MARPLNDAVNSIRPIADAKHITISTDIHLTVGRLIGDANRLQQVVGNLLSNSVKFTPDGGHITVTAAELVPRSNSRCATQAVVSSPSFLPHVFERFCQAGAEARSGGGLGLGLAIVRHLVELHGGSVTAYSEGLGWAPFSHVRFPSLR
jgi:signal transduction histidine kinase